MTILDIYDDIDGFDNITDTDAWSCDIGQWLSECGQYLIKQFEEEGNYCGFDVYFNPQGKEEPEWTEDSLDSKHLSWANSLDEATSAIARNDERLRFISHQRRGRND
tara:strand:+ start:201 stop:521 length:321 start_codon:yes stop_codon:yes gene_type:complete